MKSSFKRSFKTWHWVTVCILAVSIVGFVSNLRSQAVVPAYTITDLGTLGGSPNQSHGYGINNCGTTVGDSIAPGGIPIAHPFYKKGATMTDVGTLGGDSVAYSLNASGYTVGYSSTSVQRAILWHDNDNDGVSDPGELQEILPAGATGIAYEINDNNRVVGLMDTSGGSNLSDTPFVWDALNGAQSLPAAPAGMTPTRALGINNAGTIAGWVVLSPSGRTHAFILKNTTYIDLGTLDNSNSIQSFASRISEDAHVVGYSQIASNNAIIPLHPFVWFDANANNTSEAGEMKDLGTLSGTNAYAFDINASAYVVGASEVTGGGTHAFVWHDDNANGVSDPGEMKDLNDQFSDATWTTLIEAHSINDGGQIVGWGTKSNGETHAFLLTPIGFTPPPCPGAQAATSITNVSGSGTFGGTATLTATLMSGGTPVSAKTISFTLNSTAVCGGGTGVTCPVTNASGIASLSGVSLAGFNATNYPGAVGASFVGDSGYASSNGTGALTVAKATLTITADNKVKLVGDPNPPLTFTPTGFVNGDTSSVLSGTPALTTTATQGSPVGSYPITITQGTLTATNYSFTFVNGTLTVTEAAPVILLETGTNNAAAVDSVTFVRGPFSVTDNFNFSGDHVTRIIIFTAPLANPDATLKVFASGHELQVESFGSVTGVPGLSASYIVVKLDPVLTGSGPINYDLTVSLRGVTSNTATLTIIP